MNRDNWRTTVITLTTRFPFTFGWLVGGAEWAMGIVRGRRPPTPHGLRAFRHHRGPARHRAPGKNVHPNGRRSDTSRSTTHATPPCT